MNNGKYNGKPGARYGKPDTKPGRPLPGKKPAAKTATKTISRQTASSETGRKYTGGLQIEGRNAILEALRSGAGITALYLQEGIGGAEIEEIRALSEKAGVTPQTVKSERLQSLAESKNPQGAVAKFREYRFYDVEDMLEDARMRGEDPFIVVLSGIEDPHNFGAIVRTACLLGAHGVVIRKDRAAGVTPAVAKSSAGALFRMKVAEVTNIAATLDKLKKAGLWAACADMDGKKPEECDLKGPVALVIGAEGDGVPRLVREKCDLVVSVPMVRVGTVDSLKASVAAGIRMYEITRQRGI